MVKRLALVLAVTLALASPASAQSILADAINAERAHAGLPPLAYGGALAYWSHQNDIEQLKRWQCGHFAPMGNARRQNAAWGQTSVAEVVSDWMGSPGHRANILATDCSRMGGDYLLGFWTLSFGGPMPQPKTLVSKPAALSDSTAVSEGISASRTYAAACFRPRQVAISRTVSPKTSAWVACSKSAAPPYVMMTVGRPSTLRLADVACGAAARSNAPPCRVTAGSTSRRVGRLRLFRWRCR